MKYIDADKLKKAIEGIKILDCAYIEALLEDDEMVKVSDIQSIINSHTECFNGHLETKTVKALRNLINPKPKKYGGLTINAWEQLSQLNYVKIELYENMSDELIWFLDEFISASNEHEEIKELWPDPEGFYRAHIGDECLVPDNVQVELKMRGQFKIEIKIGEDVDWNNFYDYYKGYRILGVSDE